MYGRPLVVLCLSTFLFYLSFQILLPIIPLYAIHVGGHEAQVGLIIGVFAFAAMLLRPVAGHLADWLGRRPLVVLGTAIFTLASLGYTAVGGIGAFLVLRFFHGVGMGFGPTAGTVMVADLAPVERRGEAMSMFGMTTIAPLAAGPYIGGEIFRRFGFAVAFEVAAVIAAGALVLAWTLPETRPRGALSPMNEFAWRTLFCRAALFPSTMIMALYFTYGGIMSFLPLFAQRQGLGNPGTFFTVFALSVVAVRSVAGRAADRLGRRLVVVPSLGVLAAGIVVITVARGPLVLALAGFLYGIGFGAGQPALLAMTADRVAPSERGRAMGTTYTAWEFGISSGSILLGLWAARWGFTSMWLVTAAVGAIGALPALHDVGRRRG